MSKTVQGARHDMYRFKKCKDEISPTWNLNTICGLTILIYQMNFRVSVRLCDVSMQTLVVLYNYIDNPGKKVLKSIN